MLEQSDGSIMNFQKTLDTFLQDLSQFQHELSCLDHVWNIFFPDASGKWSHLHINKYQKVYFISHVNDIEHHFPVLEVEPHKGVKSQKNFNSISPWNVEGDNFLVKKWEPLISTAIKWLKIVKQDWVRANKKVQIEYPIKFRFGVVPHGMVMHSLPDIYRLDQELGKRKSRQLIGLVESGFFMRNENTQAVTMTAADYFKYCKIAYMAGQRKGDKVDESLSGRQMYELYADGRHEGLLDINETSEQEFAQWIDGQHPKRQTGGHPWEIKRGGNTTHINLSVRRPSYLKNDAFSVELHGPSISRMAETIKMLLAIQRAGLPISIADAEGVRKRLLGQDNIGIIPCYAFYHRANQHFRNEENVYDVMHYNELGRYKRRITPFIKWEQLPIITPCDI